MSTVVKYARLTFLNLPNARLSMCASWKERRWQGISRCDSRVRRFRKGLLACGRMKTRLLWFWPARWLLENQQYWYPLLPLSDRAEGKRSVHYFHKTASKIAITHGDVTYRVHEAPRLSFDYEKGYPWYGIETWLVNHAEVAWAGRRRVLVSCMLPESPPQHAPQNFTWYMVIRTTTFGAPRLKIGKNWAKYLVKDRGIWGYLKRI